MRDPINKTRAYYLRTARSRYVKWPKTQTTKSRKSLLYIAIEKGRQLKRKHKKRQCTSIVSKLKLLWKFCFKMENLLDFMPRGKRKR